MQKSTHGVMKTKANKTKSLRLENTNIKKLVPLLSPQQLKNKIKSSPTTQESVYEARNTICRILDGSDPRLLAVVGPCSIHDYDETLDYAQKLLKIKQRVDDRIYVIMRVYFEKPRTTLGWRGLFIDPNMDNSNDIPKGLALGRKILLDVNKLGLPCGSEYLDPIVPNYIDDLVCWAAIGARTIESQTHRDMASGVSAAVGFKNNTSGDIDSAISAMVLSSTRRGFIGADTQGQTCIVHTTGNKNTHLILRGGRTGPNYFPDHVQHATEQMKQVNLNPSIMIDCSHGNSLKDYRNQRKVLESTIEQYVAGNENIKGFMLESNLKEGNQPIRNGRKNLIYGKSITDACISMKTTEELLLSAHKLLESHKKPNLFSST